MIRIMSLTVYHAESSRKLHHETFRENEFESEMVLRKWVSKMESWWSDAMRQPVRIYIVRKRRPKKNIDMLKVLEATAKVMGIEMSHVTSSSRKREYVDVRKMACTILIDYLYTPREIEKQLPFKNRVVYRYREKMEDRIALEPGFEKQYEAIKKQVEELIPNSLKDDGSGEPKKEENVTR